MVFWTSVFTELRILHNVCASEAAFPDGIESAVVWLRSQNFQEGFMERYDMTIIGGGSGGLTAARIATALGAHVLLVDKEKLGGDCLNYGCVPSKSLIHVARVVQQARDAAKLGLMPASLGVDMAKVSAYEM